MLGLKDIGLAKSSHTPEAVITAGDTMSSVEKRCALKREGMHCRVTYTYEIDNLMYTAEGTTRDFSKIGCGIRGTTTKLTVGNHTILTLYLQDLKPPLSFEATIIWIAGDFFGVTFPPLRDEYYERLARYMRNRLSK